MNTMEPVTADIFERRMRDVIAGLPPKKLPVDAGKIEAFCRITGHDFETYREKDRIPLGYLMTFTAPLINEMFLTFFTKNPNIGVKGVVHSSSIMECLGPFRLHTPFYMGEIAIQQVTDKQGRKGRSFVTDFDVRLISPQGETVLSDLHQFFVRYQ